MGLARETDDPADGLSKVKYNMMLSRLLETNVDSNPVVEWIDREVFKQSSLKGN